MLEIGREWIKRDFISSRTKEALAKRKAEGMKLGRPVGGAKNLKLDKHADKIDIYLGKGINKVAIAKLLDVSPNTLYEWLKVRRPGRHRPSDSVVVTFTATNQFMKNLFFFSCLIFIHLYVGAQGVCPKGHSIQALDAEYNQTKLMAEMYQKNGFGFEYQAELKKLQRITNKYMPAYLEQEKRNFELTRDTRCLAAVYSQIVGRQVQFQKQSNNLWSIYFDGVMTKIDLSDKELISLVGK